MTWRKLSYLFWKISTTGCPPEVPVRNACSMENQQEELEVWVWLQDYDISLRLQWCHGTAHTTGVVQWVDTDDLARTGWEAGKDLPFLWESSRDAWSSALEKVWADGSGKISCWNEPSINLEASFICFLWGKVVVGGASLCERASMPRQDVQSGARGLSQCDSETINTICSVCLRASTVSSWWCMFLIWMGTILVRSVPQMLLN